MCAMQNSLFVRSAHHQTKSPYHMSIFNDNNFDKRGFFCLIQHFSCGCDKQSKREEMNPAFEKINELKGRWVL